MMPMTFATTSRNESKLNVIGSRAARRRRYMAASVFQVLAGHRHLEELEPRIDVQEADQAAGSKLEADHRPIGRFAGLDRLLPAGDQVLHVLHDGLIDGG